MMQHRTAQRSVFLPAFSAVLASLLFIHTGVLAGENAAARSADTLYYNGTVLTMDAATPQASAIAVREGRILAVGDTDALRAAHAGAAMRAIDLGGRTLLPGFIDGHSHFAQAVTLIDWANLSAPPTGHVDSIAALLEALRAHARAHDIAPADWVIGYGYDNEALAEARHITRDDLDAAFPTNPVLVMHVSGHGMVLNSAALQRAGIDANTPTPAGGVIARRTLRRQSRQRLANIAQPTGEARVDLVQLHAKRFDLAEHLAGDLVERVGRNE